MKTDIIRLAGIAQKPSRLIVGLMSGTSLDGLDIALCEFQGSGRGTLAKVLAFKTVAFESQLKEQLKQVVSKEQVNLKKLTQLNARLGNLYGGFVSAVLSDWGYRADQIDLIASHGQTVYHCSGHDVGLRATLQIGDGDHISFATGIVTVSDFRQKNIAAGGMGAPLVPYGDYLLFTSAVENRVLLNIGGISNFTYLPAGGLFNDTFATDCGPGNTLMDQFVQANYPGTYYDRDALLALNGTLNTKLFTSLLDHEFFQEELPKTTGPELFNLHYLKQAMKLAGLTNLSAEDTLATLSWFSARAIADTLTQFSHHNLVIYLSGGGMHNPLLVANLGRLIPSVNIKSVQELGIDPDAKEALLFALLSNEAVAGEPGVFLNERGIPAVSMGKISFPG